MFFAVSSAPTHSQTLFENWEKPKLVFVFTGFLNGYIEPCGCAGLDNMKGGLSRRHTFFQELEKKGWNVLAIDAGNLNKGVSKQEELKYNFVIDESLQQMNYAASGFGNRELLFPTDTLILYSVDSPGVPKRYTSANVGIIEFSPDLVSPYRTFEKGGVKTGVVSVLCDSQLKKINNADIQTADAAAKLKEVLPKLDAEKCTKKILIVFGTDEEIDAILDSFADRFDFVLPSTTPAEPPLKPRYRHKTMIVDVGEKGRYAVAVGLFDDGVKYERVPFDSRFKMSETVTKLMQLYQTQLKEAGLKELGIRPLPYAQFETLGKFVGSAKCADCHEKAYSVWKKSKHGNAWKSLTTTAKPARHFDPECIACHSVGWNTAECLPYQNAYQSEKETPELISVGCESCHGAGGKHILAEQGTDKNVQEKIRLALRLPLENDAAKTRCVTCHDGDNSPKFDFEKYWKMVEHREE
ncbi:hypothetical protein FACS189454_01160 [Planctomycetales bacterium]|nr:hypothetical protein FACS189454_01160 [Planctomycetales bacterium]